MSVNLQIQTHFFNSGTLVTARHLGQCSSTKKSGVKGRTSAASEKKKLKALNSLTKYHKKLSNFVSQYLLYLPAQCFDWPLRRSLMWHFSNKSHHQSPLHHKRKLSSFASSLDSYHLLKVDPSGSVTRVIEAECRELLRTTQNSYSRGEKKPKRRRPTNERDYSFFFHEN